MMRNKINATGFALLMACLTACSHPPLTNTFLIPSGCEGTLRVVFGEKCGITPKVENGRQLLEFPKSGFLILNIDSDLDSGINDDFYLVDNKGNKIKVTKILNFKDRINKIPAIVYNGIGVSSSVINSVNSKVTRVSGGAAYMDFNLYNKDTIEIRNSVSSQKLDKLTNALVNACRMNK